MPVMISLIGDQPIPNLLPIRYYKPKATIAVYSGRTEKAYLRLKDLAERQLEVWPLPVEAYDISQIRTALLNEIRKRKEKTREILFNLTGGTKPMSLAAYLTASELGAPMVYLQSEGKRSRLFCYEFQDGEPVLVKDFLLPNLITIEDYLMAYIGREYGQRKSIPDDDGHRFEQAIANALKQVMDEMISGMSLKGVVDVDLIVRCENQVGILEAKLGKHHLKQGIDQLNTAGGQTFLGTYTQKFLVSDQNWKNYPGLKELAAARSITIIELPGSRKLASLSDKNAAKIQQIISQGLGRQ